MENKASFCSFRSLVKSMVFVVCIVSYIYWIMKYWNINVCLWRWLNLNFIQSTIKVDYMKESGIDERNWEGTYGIE